MKKSDPVLIIVILATIALLFFECTPPMRKNNELNQQLIEVQAERNALKKQIEELQQKIDKLNRGDANAIEEVVRDKYGYSREGEQIYHLDNSATPQNTPKADAE
jgi:cell division protein DivIC